MKGFFPWFGVCSLGICCLLAGCGKTSSSDDAPGDGEPGGAGGTSTGGSAAGGSDSGGSSTGGGDGLPSDCAGSDDYSEKCEAAKQTVCGSRSEAACEGLSFCSNLTAQRIDEVAQCAEPDRQWVGCGLLGCGGLLTRGRDPEGKAWLFPSTCLPSGWSEEGSSVPEECVVDPGCAELSEEECPSTENCYAIQGADDSAGTNKHFIECQFTEFDGLNCQPAITCAHPAEEPGECLMFASTCVPTGWTKATCGELDCPSF